MVAPQTPKDMILALLAGAVPERSREIYSLWARYNPEIRLVENEVPLALKAGKDYIDFDLKTPDIFWLLSFSAWKAIECYGVHVLASYMEKRPIAECLAMDDCLGEYELDYKTRRAQAQAIIEATDPSNLPWPPDIPLPSADRDAMSDKEYKVAFDLSLLALAYAIFHEFRHVMLAQDNLRPDDLREEELQCDVWPRDFMTANLATYAQENGHDYSHLLQKRSMGLAMAALILHEITAEWAHGGNASYFSIATRIKAIVAGTSLPPDDYFWQFVAALLIGIYRQKGMNIDAPIMEAQALAEYLLDKMDVD